MHSVDEENQLEDPYRDQVYQAILSAFYRFAEFLGPDSHTISCSHKVQAIEASSIKLAKLSKEWTIRELSGHIADILAQIYPLTWSCSYAVYFELGQPQTYVDFANYISTIETMH